MDTFEVDAEITALVRRLAAGQRDGLLIEGRAGSGRTTLLARAARLGRARGLDVVSVDLTSPVPAEPRPASGRPVLLLVDDLHRHDPDRLTRRIRAAGGATAGVVAVTELGRPCAETVWLPRRVVLDGLDRESARTLARRHFVDLPCGDALAGAFDRTEGNPGHLDVLYASMREREVDVFDARAADGDSPALARAAETVLDTREDDRADWEAVLTAVAVLEPYATPAAVAGMVGSEIGGEVGGPVVGTLRAFGYLAPQGGVLVVRPPVLRAGLLARLSTPDRAGWHAAAARHLSGRCPDEIVVEHVVRSRPDRLSADQCALLHREANRAIELGEIVRARDLLLRVVESGDPGSRPAASHDIAWLTLEDPARAAGHLRSVVAAAPRSAAADRARTLDAHMLVLSNDVGRAVEILREGDLTDEERALRALVGLPPLSGEDGGPGGDRAALVATAHDALRGGTRRADCLHTARRALDLPDDPRRAPLCSMLPILFLARAGDLDGALSRIGRTGRAWEPPPIAAWNTSIEAEVHLRHGDLLAAGDAAAAALAVAGEQVRPGIGPMASPVALSLFQRCAGLLVTVLLERDDAVAAQECLERHHLEGPIEPCPGAAQLLVARGRLRMAQGRPETALADFTRCRDVLRAHGVRTASATGCLLWSALAQRDAGHVEEAERTAREALSDARRWGAPEILGETLVGYATITSGPARDSLLCEAIDVLEGSGARLAYASALLELGRLRRRTGAAAEARTLLQTALAQAQRCGATRLERLATGERRRAGARPRRVAEIGVESLTPAERRVSELAARGLTNREIADRLYVRRRTVEVHLSRAYGKLGARGRDDLRHVRALLDPALSSPTETS